MKVINLFGGPGSGKTTTSFGLSYFLKGKYDINSEFVPEYVKTLAWENNLEGIKNQLDILSNQNKGLFRLVGKVDYAVCDSPLFLSLVYCDKVGYKDNHFKEYAFALFNNYENLNYLIRRRKKYNPSGRFQTEDEAKVLDVDIENAMKKYNVPYQIIEGDEDAVEKILKSLNDDRIKIRNDKLVVQVEGLNKTKSTMRLEDLKEIEKIHGLIGLREALEMLYRSTIGENNKL